MATLTKADMAEHLFTEMGFSKREAKKLVDQMFEEMRRALEDNEAVKLSGFGNFETRDKVARPGRNPKTGVEVTITPRRVVTFRAGRKLRDRVDKQTGAHAGSEPSQSAGGPPQSTGGPPQSTGGPPQSADGPPQSAGGPSQSADSPPQSADSPPGSDETGT